MKCRPSLRVPSLLSCQLRRNLAKKLLAAFAALLVVACAEEKTFTAKQAKRLPPVEVPPPASDNAEPEPPPVVTTKDPTTLAATFDTGTSEHGQLVIDGENIISESTLTLTESARPLEDTFQQENRPTLAKTFSQGVNGRSVTEDFSQSQMGVLDIVVVVDNSGSMKEEQINLSTKLNPLIDKVRNSNWQIGLVTTDPKDGCLIDVFFHNQPNVADAFRNRVAAIGTSGSGNERGIKQAVAALSCSNWVRDNSNIAVLIVSDEDNCSVGDGSDSDCEGDDYSKASYLTDALTKTFRRKLGTSAKVYGIFFQKDTICTSGENVANVYQQAVDMTTGVSGSICDSDYSGTLTQISEDMQENLLVQFPLSQKPLGNATRVFVNEQEIHTGFTIKDQTLIFSDAPDHGAAIKVSYTTKKSTMASSFTIDNKADASTLEVFVDGIAMNHDSFTFNQNGDLTFRQVPRELAKIIVKYKETKGLNDKFRLSEPSDGNLEVSVNGYQIAPQDYRVLANGRDIKFNTPPKDGATVAIRYQGLPGQVLKYPLPLPLDNLQGITVTDQQDHQPVAFQIEGDRLIIDKSNFEAGRVLSVVATYSSADLNEVSLPIDPLIDSVVISGIPEGCQNGGITYTAASNVIAIGCRLTADDSIVVDYEYVTNFIGEFTLGGAFDASQAQWRVFIDDTEITDFTVAGQTVQLAEPLGPGHQVRVEATYREE